MRKCCANCPPECHKTGKLYQHHSGPYLSKVEDITAAERETLWRCAKSFDQMPAEEPHRAKSKSREGGLSPGDDYCNRGPDFLDILEPHGWKVVHQSGGIQYLRRPDKDGEGWSATLGYCTSKDGRELFAVFSSNAGPFEGPSGGKNCSCYSKFACYALLNHGGDFSKAAKQLYEDGYGERKEKKAKSTHHAGDASGDGFHLTDTGNAQRVRERHGANLHYCFAWRKWLIYDNERWADDETGRIVRAVNETQRVLYQQTLTDLGNANTEVEKNRLMAVLAHCLKWEQTKAINSCIEALRAQPCIPIRPKDLDADLFLFNTQTGTLNLRTGQLQPHDRRDLISKIAPVEYQPDAKCPLWLAFLDRIMAGNTRLIDYLQRVAGYSLTGCVDEQCLWFFYGTGANGKSVFLNTLRGLMGDYGGQAVSDLLMQKSHQSHPTEQANLFGKRFVATVETDEGKRLAESLMKQITGGENINARRLYQDLFEFTPTHKVFLSANCKPVVRGQDHGVWRRIKLIPFEVTIPEGERDKQLPEKLKAEWPGILAWALCGCLAWQRDGMQEPDEVRKATAEYQSDQDSIMQFLDTCCFLHPECKIRSSYLFESYQDFTGDKWTTQKAFSERLKKLGYQNKVGSHGYTFWHGIGLCSKEEDSGNTVGDPSPFKD